MPIPRGAYVPLPAVIPRRVVDTRTLGDLLQRQGENDLQYQLAKGQSAAQMWQQLGRLFSSYAQGTREDQTKAALLEQRKQEQQRDDALKLAEFEDKKAAREEAAQLKADAEKRRLTDEAAKVGEAVASAAGYGPISEPQMEQVLQSPVAATRARYSFGPGTAEGPELLPTRDQQEDIAFRKAVEAKGGMVSPKGQAVMPPAPRQEPNPTEASLALMAAKGDRGAQRALEIIARQKPAAAPKAKFWIVRDGKQLRISEDEYQPGDLPASTREQGRPVTSGDAGRMADLDNSLTMLGGLGAKLGTTGAASKIGAMLPNVVTEYTGWGSDAKSRQATIDQVKQIIGKALEGGVLRKEDEVKYEKILPVIGDPPDVALAKISGLKQTLADKRQATLDALADSGYDTSRFQARTEPKVSAVPDLSGLRKDTGRKFTSGPFAGQTWSVDANGKPFKVGG